MPAWATAQPLFMMYVVAWQSKQPSCLRNPSQMFAVMLLCLQEAPAPEAPGLYATYVQHLIEKASQTQSCLGTQV